MKKQIEDIKQFVIDRFKPQGIEIDLDFGTLGSEYTMCMFLTPRESKDREHFDWGRTVTILRERFTYATFYTLEEYVYPDEFLSERIVFKLN